MCISAVKEKDIDAKMKQVRADWAVQNLAFAPFKTRGELLLRGEETREIVSLMEDSLMVLGSLMSNRWVDLDIVYSLWNSFVHFIIKYKTHRATKTNRVLV